MSVWESRLQPHLVPTPLRPASRRLASLSSSSSCKAGNAVATSVVSRAVLAEGDDTQDTDRFLFASNLDDYVKCPGCNAVFAAQPAVPPPPPRVDKLCNSNTTRALVPACYAAGVPAGANLSTEDAIKHLNRSRFRCPQCGTDFCRCGASPYHWGWSCDSWQRHQQGKEDTSVSNCRWCYQPILPKRRWTQGKFSLQSAPCCGNDGDTDLTACPPVLSCAEKERRSCKKRHACGHWCGGVTNETDCLPCLHKECISAARPAASCGSVGGEDGRSSCSSSCGKLCARSKPTRSKPMQLPNRDDWCPICWTETLGAAPSVQLACGHIMHHHCLEAMVQGSNAATKRLTFESIRCPICQAIVRHSSLDQILEPQMALYLKVRRMALDRHSRLRPHSKALSEDEITALLSRMCFFKCSSCDEPYYGGEAECGSNGEQPRVGHDAPQQNQEAAAELLCPGCASRGKATCKMHGRDFITWKCRYCCERPASFFCFGTTHFCYQCHEAWAKGRAAKAQQPCHGGSRCIFKGKHPPGCANGVDEYALGCALCAEDSGGLTCPEPPQKSSSSKRAHCAVM